MTSSGPRAPRSAIVAGSTGLVGSRLVQELLARPDYSTVTALVRRPTTERAPVAAGTPRAKPSEIVVDYERLAQTAPPGRADDAFCCLGTTIKTAGSPAAFQRVDLDYVVEFARLCKRSGAKRFLLVSSSGADAASRILYSRTKGLAERAVADLGFETTYLFRPSLLLGPRSDSRPLERLAQLALPLFSPLLGGPLRRYRPIAAEAVARAMARSALASATGVITLESDQIADLGRLGEAGSMGRAG